jgi:O-antigen ligase
MILFGLIAIIRAAFRYDDIGITAWFYSELSGNFHTSYVALYACWAVALLAEMWQMKSDKNWYYWLATAFLLFFVVLLASKAGFLAAILTVCLVAIYLFKNKFTSIRYWLFTLSAALVLLLGSIYSPSLNQRLAAAGASVALNNENDNPITQSDTTSVSQGSTNLRLAAMEAGFNYFIKNPFGAGTGDLDLAMAEEYKFMNQKEAGEKQLNPHNQYLSTAVALGWPGFLLILAIVFYPAWIFFKRKKLIWLILPLITAFNLLFESMLEQQAGIVFFIFWSILLLADIEEHSVQT